MTKAKRHEESLPDVRTPMERFNDLGQKILRVPREEVLELEKKQRSRARRKAKKR